MIYPSYTMKREWVITLDGNIQERLVLRVDSYVTSADITKGKRNNTKTIFA